MKKTSLFALAVIYLLMFISLVIALPASKWSILLLILTGVIGATHTHFVKKRNEKIEWGSINRPFAVIDWGQDGKRFELPARHHGHYIACSAAHVRDNVAFVTYSLSNAGNMAFIKSQMPVLQFYFGKGAHILEDQETYRFRVLSDFDHALVDWHVRLEKDEDAYVRAFLAGNQNGSIEE